MVHSRTLRHLSVKEREREEEGEELCGVLSFLPILTTDKYLLLVTNNNKLANNLISKGQ